MDVRSSSPARRVRLTIAMTTAAASAGAVTTTAL
jgi:hypothetical protein